MSIYCLHIIVVISLGLHVAYLCGSRFIIVSAREIRALLASACVHAWEIRRHATRERSASLALRFHLRRHATRERWVPWHTSEARMRNELCSHKKCAYRHPSERTEGAKDALVFSLCLRLISRAWEAREIRRFSRDSAHEFSRAESRVSKARTLLFSRAREI